MESLLFTRYSTNATSYNILSCQILQLGLVGCFPLQIKLRSSGIVEEQEGSEVTLDSIHSSKKELLFFPILLQIGQMNSDSAFLTLITSRLLSIDLSLMIQS